MLRKRRSHYNYKLKNLLFYIKKKMLKKIKKKEDLIDFDDFDKPEVFRAFIRRMSVCNEGVSPCYI
jgi:hypothetical protein